MSTQIKHAIHSPPMPIGATKSSQWNASPSRRTSGISIQNISTRRINSTKIATSESKIGLRLLPRASRIRNGAMNWKITSASVKNHQPPSARRRYQGLSSGRLADQMIRNCERFM